MQNFGQDEDEEDEAEDGDTKQTELGSLDRKQKRFAKYKNLDEKSLRIIMKVYNYLKTTNKTLTTLFGDFIYSQTVKTSRQAESYDLIKSEHFFNCL